MGNNCCVDSKKRGQSKHQTDDQQFQKKYYEDIPDDVNNPNNQLNNNKHINSNKSQTNNSKKVFKKNNGISLQGDSEKENQKQLSQAEIRQKMVEAAEQRKQKSDFRGVTNKDAQIEQQFKQQQQVLAQKYQNNSNQDQVRLRWD